MNGKISSFQIIIIKQDKDKIRDFDLEYKRYYDTKMIVDKLDQSKSNFIFIHFRGCDSEKAFFDAIDNLKVLIKENGFPNLKKIYIFPFSSECKGTNKYCKKANELNEFLTINSKEKITENIIKDLTDFWVKEGQKKQKISKKINIMNSVLPFCIHCKNASIWISNKKDFEKYFEERKEHIKDSLVIARKILTAGKDLWGKKDDDGQKNVDFAETPEKLEKICSLVEPKNNEYELKESETKAFISQIIVEVEPEKTPGFIKLLKSLKDWVDRDNVQKQQDCCR